MSIQYIKELHLILLLAFDKLPQNIIILQACCKFTVVNANIYACNKFTATRSLPKIGAPEMYCFTWLGSGLTCKIKTRPDRLPRDTQFSLQDNIGPHKKI
jgi:hypothetical protein